MSNTTLRLEAMTQDLKKIEKCKKINRGQWEAAIDEMRTKYEDILAEDFSGSPPDPLARLIAEIQEFDSGERLR